MKKISLLAFCVFLYSIAFSQCVVDYSNLNLVFEDNFDNQTTFNQKWLVRPFPDHCPSEYDDQIYTTSTDNVFLSNGNLNIRAIRQTSPVPVNVISCEKEYVNYTSGMLQTNTSYLYGYFEARCKMSPGSGSFPAFWLFSYPGDEIDIFEFGGGSPDKFSNNVIDWKYPGETSPRKGCQSEFRQDKCSDLTQEFHTYGMAWTPTAITFFFDGKELRTVDISNFFYETCSPSDTNICPMPIILNLAVNSWASFSSSTFLIDYVKAYSINNLQLPIKKEPFTAMNWPSNSIEASSQSSSVAFGEDQVFFKSPNGWIASAYYSNGWHSNYLTATWNANEIAEGDVVVGENNEVFFRGQSDGKLHRYYYNSGWQHEVLGGSSCNITVSSSPGSIAVGKCNQIFVKDPNGWVASFYKTNGSYACNFLTTTWNSIEVASGSLVAKENIICYRGANGQISYYYWDPTLGWSFVQLNGTLPTNTYVSSQPGSIWASIVPVFGGGTGLHIFYRGADNFIQQFYYDNGWHHSYLTSSFNSAELVGGNITGSGQYVFYIGSDSKIHQYKWTSSGWTTENLNVTVHSNLQAREMNNQLIYRGTNEFVNNYFWRNCSYQENTCMGSYSLSKEAPSIYYQPEEQLGNSIEVSPNPASDKLNISLGNNSLYFKVEIIDFSGKIIQESMLKTSFSEINIAEIPAGFYFLKFYGNNGFDTRKFIKE